MVQDTPTGDSHKTQADAITLPPGELGRLQRDNDRLRQQTAELRQEVTDRRQENQDLRNALHGLQVSPDSVFPEPEPKDPQTYEEERDQHPHRKIYRKDGTALLLMEDWQLIGASRRGRGHGYKSLWRDDDFSVRPFAQGHGVAVAIADGLGTRPFSRWGARAASHGAMIGPEESQLIKLTQLVDETGAALTGRHHRSDRDIRTFCAERDMLATHTLFTMLQSARGAVEHRAQSRGKTTDELHSTLLLFLAIPHDRNFIYLASAQIGDGGLYACLQQGSDATWVFPEPPQASGINNQVQPFMAVPAIAFKDFIHTTELASPLCLLGMTDGTLDDLDWDPDENGRFSGIQGFHEMLEQEVQAAKRPAEGLDDFLGYFRINSLDDRTVLYMYRQP